MAHSAPCDGTVGFADGTRVVGPGVGSVLTPSRSSVVDSAPAKAQALSRPALASASPWTALTLPRLVLGAGVLGAGVAADVGARGRNWAGVADRRGVEALPCSALPCSALRYWRCGTRRCRARCCRARRCRARRCGTGAAVLGAGVAGTRRCCARRCRSSALPCSALPCSALAS